MRDASLVIGTCAGYDNLLLSVGEAIEALVPPTPPPPAPACSGCQPIAATQKATYNGTGPVQNGQITSAYTLNFAGNCSVKASLGASLPLTAQTAAT
jgi:hypothetical protein